MAMTEDKKIIGSAVASPTKQFFVKMLTRDIELQDAILDLLDNCVDGILRSQKVDGDSPVPYEGFEARITISPNHFSIEDNCGGIPIETARKYAFAMGRPAEAADENSPATVGMYGIGMKRAIFKIGTDALIESRHDTGFYVEITPQWMQDDKWDELPMVELDADRLPKLGTSITVMTVDEDVKPAFGDPKWIDDFRKIVARHYSIIIGKGFAVHIGDGRGEPNKVPAEPIKFLTTAADETGQRIAPFAYRGKLGDVDVEIYAGLYRELQTAEEADRDEDTRGSSDDAGWTVACNDRVVIWKDKTRLTGWGEATVPNYHGQFIAITGIVLLHSSDPKKLPLTTTKRGIDAASNVYSEAKDLMRDATKNLTSFTNKWKNFPEKLQTIYRASEYVDLSAIRKTAAAEQMTPLRRLPTMARTAPQYPQPVEEKTHVVVKFEAQKTDVKLLADAYYGEDQPSKPSDVGREAFRRAVAAASKGKP